MGDIELVVTDLDGTLWLNDLEVHPRVLNAWTEVGDRGVPILAASGRRVATIRDSLGRFGWQPSAVALNGAVGLDLRTGERFHSRGFDPSLARAVLECFRAQDLEPCVYVDDPEVDAYVSDHASTHPGHLLGFGTAARIGDLEEVVASLTVLAFSLIGCPTEGLQSIVDGLAGRAEAHLSPSFSYDGGDLSVAPLGLSKWDGVVAYCGLHGVDETRVLAIGDGPNDVELLRNAGVSVSLDGSHPAALEVARHIVPSVLDGGWAHLLELI